MLSFSPQSSDFICFIALHAEGTIRRTLKSVRRTSRRCRLTPPSPMQPQSIRSLDIRSTKSIGSRSVWALAAWARSIARATCLIDRPVAVKVLNPRFVEDEAARTQVSPRSESCGRLQHANAVTVTDFGESQDGYVYLVMELLEGRTLRDVLAKEAPLDAARSVSLMLQISAAVAAAHEAGIIHRDLKPANIFIVQRAEVPAVVKVLDFGIAKLAADSSGRRRSDDADAGWRDDRNAALHVA